MVDEYLGLSAYMAAPALGALLGEREWISGVHLLVDPRHESALHQRLTAMPAVAGVALTRAMKDAFDRTMGETMGVMIAFNVLFAAVIAFRVAYNAARISLSERSRELASLRVLGFTRAEISAILLGELAVLTVLAARNLVPAVRFVDGLRGSDEEITRLVEDNKKHYAGIELPHRTLGVIGPQRMPYDRMIQIVDVTAKLVSNALSHTK